MQRLNVVSNKYCTRANCRGYGKSILRGLKERMNRITVRIHDRAIVAAATLSNRYLTERFTRQSTDLIDEASAMIRTEIDSMPQELDAVTRRIMQLEIEEQALRKKRIQQVNHG